MKLTRPTHLSGKGINDEFGDNQHHLLDCSATLPSYGRVRAIQALASLLLVLAASAVYYLWHEAEIGAQLLEGELRTTIAAEPWFALPSGDGEGADHLPAHATSVKVQGITFFGPVASAQVETTYMEPDGRTFLAQQRRFYQPAQSGWVRVTPTSVILGSPQRYETDFFTFIYYQLDSEAVGSVATEIDAVYADLRKDYTLPPVAERVVVELVVAPPYPSGCHRRYRLCIESPALALLTSDVTQTEALRLWLVSALAYQIAWDATEIAPFQYGWQYAAYTLPRIQMRQHSARLAAWHNDLARWLYGIEARTPTPDAHTLAQELARLCDTHHIQAYQSLMAEVATTQLCVTPPLLDLQYLAQENQTQLPDRISKLTTPDAEMTISESSWMSVLAFETLLDYTMATYGDDALPKLVDGFRRYDTWDALIPALFDLSTERFEAGWRAYLVKEYHQDTK
ncbi:MAG: hypothetical protein IT328_19825 [Caldilineaceae bacterium]|nr:hypothetical protein [Caldilineaceae bacterium]